MSKALEISNLSYSYRGHWLIDKREVLNNVTLDVATGESFGFLGHNGAGKTTTIKSILGITHIRQGTIRVFGHDHRDIRARSLIGYLPEQPYFYDHLNVEEILTMYATLAGVPSRETSKARAEALELVKLSGRTRMPLRSLSKGLVQRVGMAQAIIAKPKLLILDEPFSGLDPIGRKDFRELLSHLKANGTTIFMSSHILSDVAFLCERVSIMSKGEIKGIVNVRDIPSLSEPRFELIVEENGISKCTLFNSRAQADAALKAALQANVRINSFAVVQDTLEDVFVKLVQFDESRGA